ncbi:MAG: response regulator [Candidatus Omnitrophica bacterium]|nr:response regulator [Candidatus Omnitrophota bacterium]
MEGKIKILVVDDETDALELFKDLFASKGYEVECAPGGMEALALVEKSNIDVVLLDINMPVIDGIETLAKLKQKKPDLPVVMLTAYGYDEELVNKALGLGASGYISKNLPLAQIVHTFKTVLSTIHRK